MIRVLLMLGLLAMPTLAQAEDGFEMLPEGYTLLNISADEQTEVEQDQIVVNLRIEKEGSDPTALQNDVNELMTEALKKAKALKAEDFEYTTQGYSVYDYTNNNIKRWRAQQGLILKGKSATEILELSGELQKLGFVSNSIQYTVSPELYRETRDALLEDTLKKLDARAGRVQKALAKKSYDFVEVNVDASGNQFSAMPKLARGMAMMESVDAMAPPVAAAGTSTISMRVSARVLLKP